MTPRERVLAALAHQEPDRVPFDFWAEEPAWNRLLAHLAQSRRSFRGRKSRAPTAGSERGSPLAAREQVLRLLGIDLRHIEVPAPPERPLGNGVFQNFWGERYVYRPTPWGPMREDIKGALAEAASFADLEAFPWPNPDCFNHAGLKRQADAHCAYALLYGFADVWERPALVRGWEQMFLDMATRPDWMHFLCRKFTDFYLEDYTRAAEVTQGRIDLYLLISDLGGQRGPLISPAMFQQFVAPYLKEMIDRIHNLGARVLFHSCGAIHRLIPDLMKLGVDVLDPIQPVGPTMAPERLKADFGKGLCFHGGLDMQRLLPWGTPEQVRREARRYCEVLGKGGGYILAPAHFFQPDVPPQNILAMYGGGERGLGGDS